MIFVKVKIKLKKLSLENFVLKFVITKVKPHCTNQKLWSAYFVLFHAQINNSHLLKEQMAYQFQNQSLPVTKCPTRDEKKVISSFPQRDEMVGFFTKTLLVLIETIYINI